MNRNQVRIQTVAVPTEAPKIDAGLVLRTIVYAVAIINAVLAIFGIDFNIELHEDKLYELITVIFTVGSFVLAYWKNNNVTKKARIKDEAVKSLNVPE